jgi:hypothetical protein
LHVANCRFLTQKTEVQILLRGAGPAEVRNSEFLLSPTYTCAAGTYQTWALDWWPEKRLVADNCLFTSAFSVVHKVGRPKGASLRLTRNAFRAGQPVFRFEVRDPGDHGRAFAEEDWTVPALRVEASGNLFHGDSVFGFHQFVKEILPPGEAEACLTRMVGWQGERNVYPVGRAFLKLTCQPRRDLPPAKLPAGLAGWKQLWGTAEAESVEGRVRYQGGDPLAKVEVAAEKLTPEDFRLRADSAGHRAGADGKDLGPDVDLVGPGPAYERWKKTPDYQQWRKETGQAK